LEVEGYPFSYIVGQYGLWETKPYHAIHNFLVGDDFYLVFTHPNPQNVIMATYTMRR
jgi:hypothetical protein